VKASKGLGLPSELASRLFLWIGIVGTAAFYLLPYVWIILTSLKSNAELFVSPPLILGANPNLLRYVDVFFAPSFFPTLRNSVMVAATSTLVTLGAVIPASYALVRFQIRGRRTLLLLFLGLMLFPPVSFLGYLFTLVRFLGVFDNVLGVILPYIALGIPLGIWVMTSFIKSVPVELEEAAVVDGASRFEVLRRIVLPLTGPGVAAAALIIFITSWNEFLIALTVTLYQARTVTIGVILFAGLYTINWAELTSAAVIASLPVVIAAIIAQRLIVRGLTAGAVKG
jgi:ABC-type glycerol-3-phosphate transport system permease component